MTTAVELCARAMVMLGAEPIASLGENSTEAQVAATLYPLVRDELLTVRAWHFATGQRRLAPLVLTPVQGWRYAYQLPADYLWTVAFKADGARISSPYAILERRIHSDVEHPVLTYVFRANEAGMPPLFQAALVARLAAEFCIPITDNTQRAELMQKNAQAALERARQAEARETPPLALQSFPLVDVRG